jgi:hypothetical protein
VEIGLANSASAGYPSPLQLTRLYQQWRMGVLMRPYVVAIGEAGGTIVRESAQAGPE